MVVVKSILYFFFIVLLIVISPFVLLYSLIILLYQRITISRSEKQKWMFAKMDFKKRIRNWIPVPIKI